MTFLPVYIWLIAFCMIVQTGWAAEEPEPVSNPKMQVLDLIFKVENLAGNVQDLQVKETDLEIRVELASDVLFDFVSIRINYKTLHTNSPIKTTDSN